MKILLIGLLLLAGCSKTPQERADLIERGELRRELFVECMELAAKNGRKGDDDVSDIVNACNSHSQYLLNTMRP